MRAGLHLEAERLYRVDGEADALGLVGAADGATIPMV